MTPQMLNWIASKDLAVFARKAFEVLNPGATLEDNWHIEAIIYVLDELRAGSWRHQIINMPPRTLKSQLCSVIWPAFLLGQNPSAKIAVVSYAEPLAEELSTQCRRLMQSPFYRGVFPGTLLDKQTSLLLTTKLGGERYATTIGGSFTGIGADFIIMDDPIKASDAYSPAMRDAAFNFFKQTLYSRLNHPSQGRFLLVMQRLHEDDLSGHLLRVGGWRHLKLPAQATEAASIPIGGGRYHQIDENDLLFPSRLSQDVLDLQRQTMGSAIYSAQYQQEPIPTDGAMIKRAWLQYFATPLTLPGPVTLSLDTASKDNPQNDYSVCTAWVEANGKHHLIDVWRAKVDFPTLLHRVDMLLARHRPSNILIEDAGSGTTLRQLLQRKGVPAVACKPKDSKIVRLSSVSQYFESGLVWLPNDAPWLAAFEAELLGFPAARYDDQVDSVSQYLGWVRDRPQSTFSCDWGWDEAGPIAHELIADRLLMR